MQQQVTFPSGTVDYLFQSSFEDLWQTYDKEHTVIITNEQIAKIYARLFKGVKLVVIPPGENSKDLYTISSLAKQLLELQDTRKT